MNRIIKLVAKIFLAIIIIICFLGVGYCSYFLLTSYRLPDNKKLKIDTLSTNSSKKLKTGKTYSITTYNIGFGAYTPDYSFFMDGGTSSWAKSKKSVVATVGGAYDYIKSLNTDFSLFQEVDTNATRSYQVDEYNMLKNSFGKYRCSLFCQNYDSPYIIYPFNQPHGSNKSGLAMVSRFKLNNNVRRSLPVSSSIKRVLDLDRCYTVSKVSVKNGKSLVIYNAHLSAYGTDDNVMLRQVKMLIADMKKEYDNGNYVICGGDFNCDLNKAENSKSSDVTWAQPFPRSCFPKGLKFCMDRKEYKYLKDKIIIDHPTCRNADKPYNKKDSFTLTVDGFIVSSNVKCEGYTNLDLGYKYSDHDPVLMKFQLIKDKS